MGGATLTLSDISTEVHILYVCIVYTECASYTQYIQNMQLVVHI